MTDKNEPKRSKAEAARRKHLVDSARIAMSHLTAEERAVIFNELGVCGCRSIVKAAVDHPRMAAGAIIGALVFEGLAALSEPSPKTPQSALMAPKYDDGK